MVAMASLAIIQYFANSFSVTNLHLQYILPVSSRGMTEIACSTSFCVEELAEMLRVGSAVWLIGIWVR